MERNIQKKMLQKNDSIVVEYWNSGKLRTYTRRLKKENHLKALKKISENRRFHSIYSAGFQEPKGTLIIDSKL